MACSTTDVLLRVLRRAPTTRKTNRRPLWTTMRSSSAMPSGQLEPIHGIKDRASKVLPRTFSIFQHELRNKTIRRLLAWRRR